MTFDRRRFLFTAGASLAASRIVRSAESDERKSAIPAPPAGGRDWAWVRDQFELSRDWAHFASFYIASHPRPVRDAIDNLRRAMDENPFEVVEHGLFTRPDEVRRAAALYIGGRPEDIALTRCTTEGLAFIYAGLRIKPGAEILTTTHDHYSHHESIRLARVGRAARTSVAVTEGRT